MKLTPEQLAEIRDKFIFRSVEFQNTVERLCGHISAVEAERDAARNLIEAMRALQREGAEKL